MIEDYKVVDRAEIPKRRGGPIRGGMAEAIRQTAETGKALHVPKRPPSSLGAYSSLLKFDGLRVHRRADGNGGSYIWCTKIAP